MPVPFTPAPRIVIRTRPIIATTTTTMPRITNTANSTGINVVPIIIPMPIDSIAPDELALPSEFNNQS